MSFPRVVVKRKNIRNCKSGQHGYVQTFSTICCKFITKDTSYMTGLSVLNCEMPFYGINAGFVQRRKRPEKAILTLD